MQNTLGDLNNHLFEQLERLGSEDLEGDTLDKEIARSKAVTDVACRIIDTSALVLKAVIAKEELLSGGNVLPRQLEGGK